MRLRNIPGSRDAIAESVYCIKEPAACRGKWSEIFKNTNPVHIEIGMGKGKFLFRLASLHPEINYVGIEMYSSVLVRAVQKMEELAKEDKALPNLLFIRMDAREINDVFVKGEVSRIYLNFSDPWPKDRHAKRRLTSSEFLSRYEKLLESGKRIEFKTDNDDLFSFSLEQIKASGWRIIAQAFDLYSDEDMLKENIPTEYEERFAAKGNKIHKVIFTK